MVCFVVGEKLLGAELEKNVLERGIFKERNEPSTFLCTCNHALVPVNLSSSYAEAEGSHSGEEGSDAAGEGSYAEAERNESCAVFAVSLRIGVPWYEILE